MSILAAGLHYRQGWFFRCVVQNPDSRGLPAAAVAAAALVAAIQTRVALAQEELAVVAQAQSSGGPKLVEAELDGSKDRWRHKDMLLGFGLDRADKRQVAGRREDPDQASAGPRVDEPKRRVRVGVDLV